MIESPHASYVILIFERSEVGSSGVYSIFSIFQRASAVRIRRIYIGRMIAIPFVNNTVSHRSEIPITFEGNSCNIVSLISCNSRSSIPMIESPHASYAILIFERSKVGSSGVYSIFSVFQRASAVRIRRIYIGRMIAIPFVNNPIGCCNRLRLECPSTFVGDGSNYFISAIIGCAYIFCPTAKGVCTIGGCVLIALCKGCILCITNAIH